MLIMAIRIIFCTNHCTLVNYIFNRLFIPFLTVQIFRLPSTQQCVPSLAPQATWPFPYTQSCLRGCLTWFPKNTALKFLKSNLDMKFEVIYPSLSLVIRKQTRFQSRACSRVERSYCRALIKFMYLQLLVAPSCVNGEIFYPGLVWKAHFSMIFLFFQAKLVYFPWENEISKLAINVYLFIGNMREAPYCDIIKKDYKMYKRRKATNKKRKITIQLLITIVE